MKYIFYIVCAFAFVSCNNNNDGDGGTDSDLTINPAVPKSMTYSIVKTYPHDTSSFTEGLQIYNGDLYEGTGDRGRSRLLKLDLKTGKVLHAAPLTDNFFGEGITILRDTVYQLTYQEKTGFVYTLKDFKKIREFKFDTEGWGMTTDGKDLIVSDGTSNLYYYEPSTFRLLRTQSVTEGGTLAFNINELEYIDGYIYANKWQYPYILKIDPATGVVVARADLTNLTNRIKERYPEADFLNGIAYDAATKKIYITGKKWPELYEIQFSN